MNNPQPANPNWMTRLFAPPRLPARLVLLVVLLIVTHAAQTLMALPAAYWLDPRYDDGLYLLPALSASGPGLLIAAMVLYIITAGLLLARLERTKAMVLAGTLFLVHLYYLITYSRCRIPPFGWLVKIDSCGYAVTAQQWVWVGLFILMVLSLFPLPFRLPARRWFAALGILLAAGWLGAQVYGVVRAAVPASTGWQALAPVESPSARHSMGMAYDTQRMRAVLFGGEGLSNENQNILLHDTWEWNGSSWQQIHTEIAPPARKSPSMAYDERRGVVVLYGGWNHNGDLRDVWEFDGSQWIERCPYCTPAARWGATMLYNPQLQNVVLYGGVAKKDEEAEEYTWYTEAWAWNGNCWQYTGIDAASPAAYKPALVYDPEQERMLAFIDNEYGGTWVWDDNLWQRPILGVQPPNASGASWVYDPQYRRGVLYGGVQTPGVQYYNETWVFSGDGAWQKLKSPRAPMPRADQSAFYDPIRHSMIVFGGTGINGKLLNDTWELPLSDQTPGVAGEETLEH